MYWMVRADRTRHDGDASGEEAWTNGAGDFDWSLRPDNANIAKVKLGDAVIAYSYDVEAFTHIGVIVGVPEDPKKPGVTARIRLTRLADPIRRTSLNRSPVWRTARGTPRTPFSAATTFSQPINVTDRWDTIEELLLPYDRQHFDTLVENVGFGADVETDPVWDRPRPLSA